MSCNLPQNPTSTDIDIYDMKHLNGVVVTITRSGIIALWKPNFDEKELVDKAEQLKLDNGYFCCSIQVRLHAYSKQKFDVAFFEKFGKVLSMKHCPKDEAVVIEFANCNEAVLAMQEIKRKGYQSRMNTQRCSLYIQKVPRSMTTEAVTRLLKGDSKCAKDMTKRSSFACSELIFMCILLILTFEVVDEE